MVIAWVVLGVGLLLFELHHLAFYALFGAIGCLRRRRRRAGRSPTRSPLQVVAAVVVAVVGIVAVRPLVQPAFEPIAPAATVRPGVHGGLVGQEALTLDVVGDDHRLGHVRLAGERWLAVSGLGRPIPAGTRVLVTAVEGTTLVVWPVDRAGHSPTDLDPPRTDAPTANGRTS